MNYYNAIWPFWCSIFPPWTFYHLNKKPLWSFPPFGHRTIRISKWKSGFQQFFVLMGTKFKFCEHINYIIIRDDIKNFSFKICMDKINPDWPALSLVTHQSDFLRNLESVKIPLGFGGARWKFSLQSCIVGSSCIKIFFRFKISFEISS